MAGIQVIYKITEYELKCTKIKQGNYYICKDSRRMYYDVSNTTRNQLTNVIMISTEVDRIYNTNPVDGRQYYIWETNELWEYNKGWKKKVGNTHLSSAYKYTKADENGIGYIQGSYNGTNISQDVIDNNGLLGDGSIVVRDLNRVIKAKMYVDPTDNYLKISSFLNGGLAFYPNGTVDNAGALEIYSSNVNVRSTIIDSQNKIQHVDQIKLKGIGRFNGEFHATDNMYVSSNHILSNKLVINLVNDGIIQHICDGTVKPHPCTFSARSEDMEPYILDPGEFIDVSLATNLDDDRIKDSIIPETGEVVNNRIFMCPVCGKIVLADEVTYENDTYTCMGDVNEHPCTWKADYNTIGNYISNSDEITCPVCGKKQTISDIYNCSNGMSFNYDPYFSPSESTEISSPKQYLDVIISAIYDDFHIQIEGREETRSEFLDRIMSYFKPSSKSVNDLSEDDIEFEKRQLYYNYMMSLDKLTESDKICHIIENLKRDGIDSIHKSDFLDYENDIRFIIFHESTQRLFLIHIHCINDVSSNKLFDESYGNIIDNTEKRCIVYAREYTKSNTENVQYYSSYYGDSSVKISYITGRVYEENESNEDIAIGNPYANTISTDSVVRANFGNYTFNLLYEDLYYGLDSSGAGGTHTRKYDYSYFDNKVVWNSGNFDPENLNIKADQVESALRGTGSSQIYCNECSSYHKVSNLIYDNEGNIIKCPEGHILYQAQFDEDGNILNADDLEPIIGNQLGLNVSFLDSKPGSYYSPKIHSHTVSDITDFYSMIYNDFGWSLMCSAEEGSDGELKLEESKHEGITIRRIPVLVSNSEYYDTFKGENKKFEDIEEEKRIKLLSALESEIVKATGKHDIFEYNSNVDAGLLYIILPRIDENGRVEIDRSSGKYYGDSDSEVFNENIGKGYYIYGYKYMLTRGSIEIDLVGDVSGSIFLGAGSSKVETGITVNPDSHSHNTNETIYHEVPDYKRYNGNSYGFEENDLLLSKVINSVMSDLDKENYSDNATGIIDNAGKKMLINENGSLTADITGNANTANSANQADKIKNTRRFLFQGNGIEFTLETDMSKDMDKSVKSIFYEGDFDENSNPTNYKIRCVNNHYITKIFCPTCQEYFDLSEENFSITLSNGYIYSVTHNSCNTSLKTIECSECMKHYGIPVEDNYIKINFDADRHTHRAYIPNGMLIQDEANGLVSGYGKTYLGINYSDWFSTYKITPLVEVDKEVYKVPEIYLPDSVSSGFRYKSHFDFNSSYDKESQVWDSIIEKNPNLKAGDLFVSNTEVYVNGKVYLNVNDWIVCIGLTRNEDGTIADDHKWITTSSSSGGGSDTHKVISVNDIPEGNINEIIGDEGEVLLIYGEDQSDPEISVSDTVILYNTSSITEDKISEISSVYPSECLISSNGADGMSSDNRTNALQVAIEMLPPHGGTIYILGDINLVFSRSDGYEYNLLVEDNIVSLCSVDKDVVISNYPGYSSTINITTSDHNSSVPLYNYSDGYNDGTEWVNTNNINTYNQSVFNMKSGCSLTINEVDINLTYVDTEEHIYDNNVPNVYNSRFSIISNSNTNSICISNSSVSRIDYESNINVNHGQVSIATKECDLELSNTSVSNLSIFNSGSDNYSIIIIDKCYIDYQGLNPIINGNKSNINICNSIINATNNGGYGSSYPLIKTSGLCSITNNSFYSSSCIIYLFDNNGTSRITNNSFDILYAGLPSDELSIPIVNLVDSHKIDFVDNIIRYQGTINNYVTLFGTGKSGIDPTSEILIRILGNRISDSSINKLYIFYSRYAMDISSGINYDFRLCENLDPSTSFNGDLDTEVVEQVHKNTQDINNIYSILNNLMLVYNSDNSVSIETMMLSLEESINSVVAEDISDGVYGQVQKNTQDISNIYSVLNNLISIYGLK